MDYEFEAFNEGFNEGMFTIISVFDISSEDIITKMSLDTLYNNVFELYQIWQNTIKDKKLQREEDILQKKLSERMTAFKFDILRYMNKTIKKIDEENKG